MAKKANTAVRLASVYFGLKTQTKLKGRVITKADLVKSNKGNIITCKHYVSQKAKYEKGLLWFAPARQMARRVLNLPKNNICKQYKENPHFKQMTLYLAKLGEDMYYLSDFDLMWLEVSLWD